MIANIGIGTIIIIFIILFLLNDFLSLIVKIIDKHRDTTPYYKNEKRTKNETK